MRILFQSTLILFYLIQSIALAQITETTTSLYEHLISIEEIVKIEKIETEIGYEESYKIYFAQKVDHFNNQSEVFTQKFYLSHLSNSLPVVIELNGYNVDTNRANELADILSCNKITVEHRYFGESFPENPNYKFLTIEQSANDHHKIITTLKNIYKEKWITTGISKGGQTTIFHGYFFNDDADASVAYVAPLCLAQEDPRIYSFLSSVGTEECRAQMIEFQREVLKRVNTMLPAFLEKSEELGFTYSIASERKIFEYVVLEYGFAFWQWQASTCDEIPDSDESDEILLNHLEKNSPFKYFSDQDIARIASFFYQAYSELGYYGYDITPFKDLLVEVKEPTSKIFLPEGIDPEFNCIQMNKINTWIQKEANNFVFIYGEVDTWSAPAVQLTGETNSIKMIKKDGSHKTRINSFEEEDQEYIVNKLEEWLNYRIPD